MSTGPIRLVGHADRLGSDARSQILSEERADAVKAYLVSRGINANRFTTVSYGEERPIADNATAAGRAMNRRAQLIVIIQ